MCNVHIYIYVNTYIHIYICVYVYIYKHTYGQKLFTYIYIDTYIYIYICKYLILNICICICLNSGGSQPRLRHEFLCHLWARTPDNGDLPGCCEVAEHEICTVPEIERESTEGVGERRKWRLPWHTRARDESGYKIQDLQAMCMHALVYTFICIYIHILLHKSYVHMHVYYNILLAFLIRGDAAKLVLGIYIYILFYISMHMCRFFSQYTCSVNMWRCIYQLLALYKYMCVCIYSYYMKTLHLHFLFLHVNFKIYIYIYIFLYKICLQGALGSMRRSASSNAFRVSKRWRRA